MASVSKRKWNYKGQQREAWVVRYRDRGGVQKSRQFEKKKAADQYRLQVETELQSGLHIAREQSVTVAKGLKEYLDWLDERAARGEISPNFADTSRTYEGLICGEIGAIKMVDLHWRDIDRLTAMLRGHISKRTGRTFSAGTVRTIIGIVGAAIAFGMRRDYVARNVVKEARAEIGSLASPDIETFDSVQIRRLFHTLEIGRSGQTMFSISRARAMVYLAACCGLRRGEILALGLDVIDFDAGKIMVKRSLQKGDKLKLPKTTAGIRTVPMPSLVASAVKAYMQYAKPDQRGLIFRTKRGGVMAGGDIHRMWRSILCAAGLEPEAGREWFHFHALRHYAGSAWIDGGIPLADVSRLMGHANVMITARIYTHVIAEPMARADELAACADRMLPLQSAQQVRIA